MSRMSNRDDLAVLGSARGLRAGQFGKISFQDPGSGAREPAPISANRASAPERILQWPPGKNHSSREWGMLSREGGWWGSYLHNYDNDYIEIAMHSSYGFSFLYVAISACLRDFIEFNY